MTNQEWYEMEWKKSPARILAKMSDRPALCCDYCGNRVCPLSDMDCERGWQNWLEAEHKEGIEND